MNGMDIDIMGLLEARWRERSDFISDNVRVIYSGGERAERRLAFLLRGLERNTVNEILCVSDRIIVLK